ATALAIPPTTSAIITAQNFMLKPPSLGRICRSGFERQCYLTSVILVKLFCILVERDIHNLRHPFSQHRGRRPCCRARHCARSARSGHAPPPVANPLHRHLPIAPPDFVVVAEEEGSRTLRRPYGRPRGFEDRGGHRAPSSSMSPMC